MIKLFSGKKKATQTVLMELLSELLEGGGFLLSFQVEQDKDKGFLVDIFGEDEGLLKSKKGKLLLALQSYLLQVLYKEFPEEKIKVRVDSSGFWKEQESRLLSLTERLIQRVLDSHRPVLFKQTLSPYQRRLVHEKVSHSTGVRSQSFGEGFYKNMKLLPKTFKHDER